MTQQRRVLVVEDDALMGALLCDTLDSRGFVAHAVTSAVAAKRIIPAFDPDAALVDVGLGRGPSGIELVAYLAQAHPHIAPVLLTRQTSGFDLSDMPGVAFLHKSMVSDVDQVIWTIEEALRGRGGAIRQDRLVHNALAGLTRTQREVLRLIAAGYTNAQIAELRGTTVSGAEQSVASIFKALGLSEGDGIAPRVEAARRYIEAAGLPARPAS